MNQKYFLINKKFQKKDGIVNYLVKPWIEKSERGLETSNILDTSGSVSSGSDSTNPETSVSTCEGEDDKSLQDMKCNSLEKITSTIIAENKPKKANK